MTAVFECGCTSIAAAEVYEVFGMKVNFAAWEALHSCSARSHQLDASAEHNDFFYVSFC